MEKPSPETPDTSDFDLNLIEYNLSLSYEERIKQHDGALALVLELQKQGETLRSQKEENA